MQHVHFQTFDDDHETVVIHFDCELHVRGTDFTVYRNNVTDGDVLFQNGDSDLLRRIVAALLFVDDSGVVSLRVDSFRITLDKSMAVSIQDIKERVKNAASMCNIELLETNEQGFPILPEEYRS